MSISITMSTINDNLEATIDKREIITDSDKNILISTLIAMCNFKCSDMSMPIEELNEILSSTGGDYVSFVATCDNLEIYYNTKE